MTVASENIAIAIDTLERIGRERGVDNGWLWEIPAGTPHTGSGPDDPRQPLVHGGPDVVLQLCVPPMLAILRDPLAELDDNAVTLAAAIAAGRAIEHELPSPLVVLGTSPGDQCHHSDGDAACWHFGDREGRDG